MSREQELLAAARAAASTAAAYLRTQEGTQAPSAWSEKGQRDFVTEVDREAERIIAASLTTAFPESSVVGEELTPGTSVPRSRGATVPGITWIVDPLDGTTNFLHGYPAWGVSIAALAGGELLAGVVEHVPAGVTYTATRGGGAWANGRRLAVSAVTEPRQALVGTGFPVTALEELPRYLRHFAALTPATGGIRRAGSAALDLCDVAAGRFDGFWELVLNPWDVAAGALLVREAGGVVTGLDGESDVLRRGPIVAGNATIHAWLMDLLRRNR